MRQCPRCNGPIFEAEPGERSCVHCGQYWMDHARWVVEILAESIEALHEREEGLSRRCLHTAQNPLIQRGGRRKVSAA